MRPIATDVARSVVCVCVCALGKNGWTEMHVGWAADSRGSRERCIRWMGARSPTGSDTFDGGGMCRRIVTYLGTSALRPPRANVPAQRTQRTNTLLLTLVIHTVCVCVSVCMCVCVRVCLLPIGVIINKVDVIMHVRLTELHAAPQNLPCYLLTY